MQVLGGLHCRLVESYSKVFAEGEGEGQVAIIGASLLILVFMLFQV